MTTPDLAVATPKVHLFITSKIGLVHQMLAGNTCESGRGARQRKFVTPMQCLAFSLPACNDPACFPDRGDYDRLIGRRKLS
jgi:hypothetical protein